MGEYAQLLRSNRAFGTLLTATAVSNMGSAMTNLALPILAYRMTGSVLAVGLMWTIRIASSFLVLPLAGVLADRWDRRRAVILGNMASALVNLGFIVAMALRNVWALYALIFILQGLNRLMGPAGAALYPVVLKREQLVTANGLRSGLDTSLQALAPAIGAGIALRWGVAWLFAADAVSFVLAAGMLLLIPVGREHLAGRPAPLGFSLRSVSQGLHAVRSSAVLLTAFAVGFLGAAVARSFDVAAVALADRTLHVGVERVGYLYSAMSVGALAASLAVPLLGVRRWGIRAVGLAQFAAGASLVLLITASGLKAALGVLAAWMLADTLGGVVLESAVQKTVPAELYGRVSSLRLLTFTLGSLAGVGLGSAAAEWPATYPLAIGGAVMAATGMVLAGWRPVCTVDVEPSNVKE